MNIFCIKRPILLKEVDIILYWTPFSVAAFISEGSIHSFDISYVQILKSQFIDSVAKKSLDLIV